MILDKENSPTDEPLGEDRGVVAFRRHRKVTNQICFAKFYTFLLAKKSASARLNKGKYYWPVNLLRTTSLPNPHTENQHILANNKEIDRKELKSK